jgi:TRAP-type C4-dicarboxylate transport system permease small subunit
MFGISDPGICIAYLLMFLCLAFAIWYGVSHWNREEEQ